MDVVVGLIAAISHEDSYIKAAGMGMAHHAGLVKECSDQVRMHDVPLSLVEALADHAVAPSAPQLLEMGCLGFITQAASEHAVTSRVYEVAMAAASTLMSRGSARARHSAVTRTPDVLMSLCLKLREHMDRRAQVRLPNAQARVKRVSTLAECRLRCWCLQSPNADHSFHFCIASVMWVAASMPDTVVESSEATIVVSLLKHPDPLVLRYSTLSIWLLARHTPNQRTLGDVGALELLTGWLAVLVYLIKVCASAAPRQAIRGSRRAPLEAHYACCMVSQTRRATG